MAPNLEQIFGGILRAPLRTVIAAGAQQFAGLTLIASGSATVTVSTAVVQSGQLIWCAAQLGADPGTIQNSGGGIACMSIVDNVSFELVRPAGTALNHDETIMWEIRKTD